MSRKGNGYWEPYKGKFGEGYVHRMPNYESTRYSIVTYWIKDRPKKGSRKAKERKE